MGRRDVVSSFKRFRLFSREQYYCAAYGARSMTLTTAACSKRDNINEMMMITIIIFSSPTERY